jgi:Uma2 family endonuclease
MDSSGHETNMRSAARTTRPPAATVAPPPLPQRRFSVTEYHKMMDAGIIKSGDRCELIHGFIVERPRINPSHATALSKLTRRLFALLGESTLIRVQLPITLPDSEPEPDVVISIGTDDDYEIGHPGPKDILLVCEISDSSLADDQTVKLPLYAAAKLPVYWIVNLRDRRVEVYTEPRGGKNPTYRTRQDYGPDDAVPTVLVGRTIGSLAVAEILPR